MLSLNNGVNIQCFVSPFKPVVRILLSRSAHVLARVFTQTASVHKAKHHFRALKQSTRVNVGQMLDSAQLISQNNNSKKSFINTIIIDRTFSQ